MSLSFFKVKKWLLMITGRSVLHVNQNLGTRFVPGELCGYFNNLIEKVKKDKKEVLEEGSLPTVMMENGDRIIFPVAVFQYGLGCYDLYLSTNDLKYLNKFLELAKWAIDNQEDNGGWNNFFFIYPSNPYGAMCQGEAASLLVRAYKETNDLRFLTGAKKALDFMLNPKNDLIYTPDDKSLVLLEYAGKPAVLNGWIFALFGLYDVSLIDDCAKYSVSLNNTISTLKSYLAKFDCSYWSMYDLSNRIASPFYHKLHIAQLEALFLITKDPLFNKYTLLFKGYCKSPFKRIKAFFKKAKQKIKE